MHMQLEQVRAKLLTAKAKRGELAKIALASGITARTLYNLMNKDVNPNLSTLDSIEKALKKMSKEKTK